MPIAIYINETAHVEPLINWGIRAATSEHYELILIVPRRQKGSPKWDPLLKSEAEESEIFQAVFDYIASCDRLVLKEDVEDKRDYADIKSIVIDTRELVAPNPSEALVDMIGSLDLVRLILPAVNDLKSDEKNASWAQRLFLQAPCETMMVWGSPPPLSEPMKALVVADMNTESPLAARRAFQMASASEDSGKVTLLFVLPDTDEVAEQIAERRSKAIISASGANKKYFNAVTHFAESLVEGAQSQPEESYDTVLVGCRNFKKITKLVSGIRGQDEAKALAVVRPSLSIGLKVIREFQGRIRQVVPQLDREERITLVEKLDTNSKFNFDFCALISLSTLIAALGLGDNSTAVVIGAMLVAPLMTPLVGIGFSIIQGNLNLLRKARWAVLIGFANAFAIGFVVGLAGSVFDNPLPSAEMASRDYPCLVDLFVALASGIAGAYATSRKDLNGAIPGVAIAAALIPPIATSGMALSIGNFELFFGALLLFLTNVVFIVLGTSIVFWSVGIDKRLSKSGDKVDKRYVWTRYWFAAFVIASTILAISMTMLSNPFKIE